MHRLITDAVMAASCFLGSSMAMATNAEFVIFAGKAPVATYVQSMTPIPIFSALGKGVTVGISSATGVLFGDVFLNYFNVAYFPEVVSTAPGVFGGIYDENHFDIGFIQLYTQSEASPVFIPGIYTGGINAFSGNTVTVVIRAPITAPAALASVTNSLVSSVPEPATWAIMVIGMSVIGLGVRRRAKVGSSYSCASPKR